MKYALLIYGDEGARAAMPPEAQQQVGEAYMAYTEELQKSGALHAGEGLEPSQTATTVRGKDGSAVTTDGPFAETKEQLGGFYVIETPSLDEAIAWAGKIPGVTQGAAVEIRPIRDM
jgi:hypothetical protein